MSKATLSDIYPGIAFETSTIHATFVPDAGIPAQNYYYQWMADDKVVSASLHSGYVPTDADVGKTITVTVSWRDANQDWHDVAGDNGLRVVDVNEKPVGSLDVVHDAGNANLLHAQDKLTDGDGKGAVSYQWSADGNPVAGATGADFTLTPDLSGKAISVAASWTDGRGRAENVSSDVDPYLRQYSNHRGIVSVGGAIAAGQTLHANVMDQDGLKDVYYAWQGSSDGRTWTTLPGGTGADYTLGADVPALLRLQAAYGDVAGTVENHRIVYGSSAADSVETGGGDMIYTDAGDDTITYLGGPSTVDGGDGIDTFIDNGDVGVVRKADGSIHVARENAYVTELTHVERVLRTPHDGLAFDTGAGEHAGETYRLYQAAFARAPDQVGQGFWMSRLDQGVGLSTVAQAFVDSAEFKSLYGNAPGNASLVDALYQNVLHRAPDQVGHDFWTGVLDRHAATAADVLLQFSESAENVAALTGVLQPGIQYQVFPAQLPFSTRFRDVRCDDRDQTRGNKLWFFE